MHDHSITPINLSIITNVNTGIQTLATYTNLEVLTQFYIYCPDQLSCKSHVSGFGGSTLTQYTSHHDGLFLPDSSFSI